MKTIFRKYEFPDKQTFDNLISQVEDNQKYAIVELGEKTPGTFSVDILWCNCEQCPDLLWEYIHIGDSSHEFLGYDPNSYKPEEELNFNQTV